MEPKESLTGKINHENLPIQQKPAIRKKSSKKILLFVGGIFIILLIIGLFVLIKPNAQKTSDIPKETGISFSDLILSIDDFPSEENWVLEYAEKRNRSDISKDSLNRGWKSGYTASYMKTDLNDEIIAWIELEFSEYPIENISEIPRTRNPKTRIIDGVEHITTPNKLLSPNIGNDSRAYETITSDKDATYYFDNSYRIEFIKENLYIEISSYGIDQDYELLKELAGKIEAKI